MIGALARLSLLAAGCASCGRVGFEPLAAGSSGDATLAGDSPLADDAGSAAPVRVVAHTIRNVQGAGLTTAPIDTTGATLLVVAECTWATGTPQKPTDSAGNTWVASLGTYGADAAPGNIKIFYAHGPATSAAHTFVDGGSDYLSIAVVALAGTLTTPDVLDSASGATGANPLAAGSIQPSQSGEAVVAFACSGDSVATTIGIQAPFALTDHLLNGSAGAPEDMASAVLVTTSTSAVDPIWAFTGDPKVTAASAAFVHP